MAEGDEPAPDLGQLYAAVGRLMAHHLLPFHVGRRLMVAPAWFEPPPGSGDVWIRLDHRRTGALLDAEARPVAACAERPAAFGTGLHPTTQLALCMLEDVLRGGEAVLDLGTGSGVLAIAAAALGAGSVLAVDVDPIAVEVAREAVALNGVGHVVRVEQGSLERALPRAPGAAGLRADVILANILTQIIRGMLAQGLGRALAPGGRLVVSGVRASEAAEMAGAFQAAGLYLIGRMESAGWLALAARRALH